MQQQPSALFSNTSSTHCPDRLSWAATFVPTQLRRCGLTALPAVVVLAAALGTADAQTAAPRSKTVDNRGESNPGGIKVPLDPFALRLLMHWAHGYGAPFEIENNVNLAHHHEEAGPDGRRLDWTRYMEDVESLRKRAAKELRADAIGRTRSNLFQPPSFSIDLKREKQDYLSGHNLLGGANIDVGGFRMLGCAQVVITAKRQRIITYHTYYEFNDLTDANFRYPIESVIWTLGELAAELGIIPEEYPGEAPGPGLHPSIGTDYHTRIAWHDVSRVTVSPKGKILATEGYPFSASTGEPALQLIKDGELQRDAISSCAATRVDPRDQEYRARRLQQQPPTSTQPFLVHRLQGGIDPQAEAYRARRLRQLQAMQPTPGRQPQIPVTTIYSTEYEPPWIHYEHARGPRPDYAHRIYGEPVGQQ